MTKVIQRNSFFVHPEKLLILMAVDVNQHVSKLETLWSIEIQTPTHKGETGEKFSTSGHKVRH